MRALSALLDLILRGREKTLGLVLPRKAASIIIIVLAIAFAIAFFYVVNSVKLQRYFG